MKIAAFLIPFVLVPMWAQIQLRPAPPGQVAAKPAAASLSADKSLVPLEAVAELEKKLDGRISETGGTDPCIKVAGNRGVYVKGFGVMFTSDIDLINSPALSPFRPTISEADRIAVHKRKLAHVALLQKTMSEMVQAVAADPSLKSMADTDQIVVVARMVYRPWEDTTGLPGQIVVRADRRGGNIRTEQQ
jgi:hypothetical protein